MSGPGWVIEIEGTEGLGALDLMGLMTAVQTALAVSGSGATEAIEKAADAGEVMGDPLVREWSTNLADGRLLKVTREPVYRGT